MTDPAELACKQRIEAARVARLARREAERLEYQHRFLAKLPADLRTRLAASGTLTEFGALANAYGSADLTPAWVHVCAPAPFARQLEQLARLLGHAKYNADHRVLVVSRADLTRLIPGQLYEIEIYLFPSQQPRLYRGYVHEVTVTGGTFRGSRLAPLTKAGLRRALRNARRKPMAAAIARMAETTARAGAAIDDALDCAAESDARIATMEQAGRKWLDKRDQERIDAAELDVRVTLEHKVATNCDHLPKENI